MATRFHLQCARVVQAHCPDLNLVCILCLISYTLRFYFIKYDSQGVEKPDFFLLSFCKTQFSQFSLLCVFREIYTGSRIKNSVQLRLCSSWLSSAGLGGVGVDGWGHVFLYISSSLVIARLHTKNWL